MNGEITLATKAIRYMDDQGRINIPNHIRRALNLKGGNVVEVALEDDGTIRLNASEERCSLCGQNDKHFTKLDKNQLICYECAQKVAKAMLK